MAPIVIGGSALVMAMQALNFAADLYERFKATQEGKDLPEWDEVSNKNAITQGKMDKERERLGL